MSKTNILEALQDLRQGKMIILVDDEDRENEGDLVIAAEKVRPEDINFMIRNGRGLVCMPMAEELIDRLELPPMTHKNTSKYQTAFTVSIGAKYGVKTGISAADRAHTVQVAVADNASPADISIPGHIFPLRAKTGGVLIRAGHTEGCVDLMRLAGLKPAAVLCEVMNEDGTMARLPQLKKYAKQHNLRIITINDLIKYRINNEDLINEVASAKLPMKNYGQFQVKVFESLLDKAQHVALIKDNQSFNNDTLVRVHSECLTGDIFSSSRCDCGWQLDFALKKISTEGGILLYMRQEGRGIGLGNKIKAYALQDDGLDTVEANQHLGLDVDARDYGIASQILRHLKVSKIRLMTNNPSKIKGIQNCGVEVVSREPIEMSPTQDNVSYLKTKRQKMGHLLSI